jgi:WD40 repeat protein
LWKWFVNFGTGIALVDGSGSSVAFIDLITGNRRDLKFHKSEVLCLASDQEIMVTAGRDAIINVFSIPYFDQTLFSIALYGGEIMCCCVSQGFGIIASGTRDGFLVLSSLNRGAIVRVVDLKGYRAHSALITEGWGFVVVFARKIEHGQLQNILTVYNVNVLFVRKMIIPHSVTVWSNWCSPDGFDYLAFASETRKVWFCEVFYLEMVSMPVSTKTSSEIVGLKYAMKEISILMTCRNGEVLFFLIKIL